MLKLAVALRDKKISPDLLREKGLIPAILYGPKIENVRLSIDKALFDAAYKEAKKSSLLILELDGKELPALIHAIQLDPRSSSILHADLYQPPIDEKIEVVIPLKFVGDAPAVKDFSGTLLKNFYEVNVKALLQNLPHEIIVDLSSLKTFEDHITFSMLQFPEGVEAQGDLQAIVAQVTAPQDVEEDLARPAEENVETVESSQDKKAEESEESSNNTESK